MENPIIPPPAKTRPAALRRSLFRTHNYTLSVYACPYRNAETKSAKCLSFSSRQKPESLKASAKQVYFYI